jgi:endogenous inhibitor of DNA gyrase (YacG/DUF329 family)
MTIMTAADEPGLCVFCRRKAQEHAWRPFCSERCKLLDLAQWADGAYRVPAAPAADSENPEDDHEQSNPSPHDRSDRQD